MSASTPRARRPPRLSPWARHFMHAALALVVFALGIALGIALGQALNDGPPPPSTATYVRTLEPLPQQPGATTTP